WSLRRQGSGRGTASSGHPGDLQCHPRRGRGPTDGAAVPSRQGASAASQPIASNGAKRSREVARIRRLCSGRIGRLRWLARWWGLRWIWKFPDRRHGHQVEHGTSAPVNASMLTLPAFQYHSPSSIDEAIALLCAHRGQVKVVAGGTDLLPNMKHRLFTP